MLVGFPHFDYNDPAAFAARLQRMLPLEHWSALKTLNAFAQADGTTVLLVGGIVRDTLLGRPNLDLDFVCLSSALPFAQRLVPQFKALPEIADVKLTKHPDFGTARLDLVFKNGQKLHLDLATARRENYAHPAALPTVDPQPARLEEDLRRRDFSFNALAFSPATGLVNLFDGLTDLGAGLVRVLHDHSFEDDPTRLVRGLRFAARFGYRFEPHTEALAQAAIVQGFFGQLSAERQRNELTLILRELRPEEALSRLHDYNLLVAFHPTLKWDGALSQNFARLRDYYSATPSVAAYLATLLHLLEPLEIEAVVKKLRFANDEAVVALALARLWAEVRLALQPGLKNSQLYALLHPYSPALAVFEALLHVHEPQKAELIAYYRANLANLHPQTTGDFLKQQLGLKPGPRFKTWLAALHAAVLDGEVVGPEAEETFLRRVCG